MGPYAERPGAIERARRVKQRTFIALGAVGAVAAAGIVGGVNGYLDEMGKVRAMMLEGEKNATAGVTSGRNTDHRPINQECYSAYRSDVEASARLNIRKLAIINMMTKSTLNANITNIVCTNSSEAPRTTDYDQGKVNVTIPESAFVNYVYPTQVIKSDAYKTDVNMTGALANNFETALNGITNSIPALPHFEARGKDASTNMTNQLALATAQKFATESCGQAAWETTKKHITEAISSEEVSRYNETSVGKTNPIDPEDVTVQLPDKAPAANQYSNSLRAIQTAKDKSFDGMTITISDKPENQVSCQPLDPSKVEVPVEVKKAEATG